MTDSVDAYRSLLQYLKEKQYAFICPSPETHARAVQDGGYAKTLEDFFGWNLKIEHDTLSNLIPSNICKALQSSSIVSTVSQDVFRSTVRISNFYLPDINALSEENSLYYIHSSFPGTSDSVFFGPDTYLFLAFLRSIASHLPENPKTAIDVCCGSGAGVIHLARTYPQAQSIGLDLNPKALELARINAQSAGTKINFQASDLYSVVPDSIKSTGVDVIVSNPPYIASSTTEDQIPIYADGGSDLGLGLSIRIVEEGINLLVKHGVLVIYTAVSLLKSKPGHDPWLERLKGLSGVDLLEYRIIHPDMWSEEIGKGAYKDVGRIQVVGAVLKRLDRH